MNKWPWSTQKSGEYEFRCQFLTEKNGKLTEKKRTDRENWDLTEKIGIDREKKENHIFLCQIYTFFSVKFLNHLVR